MQDLLSNWIVHLLGLIGIILLCIPTKMMAKWADRFSIHRPIKEEEVRSVLFWGMNVQNGPQDATSEQKAQLIAELNQATFIVKRDHSISEESPAGATITLNNGDEVTLLLYGEDFDVVRMKKGKTIRYWARQVGIKKILSDMAY